MSIESTRLNWQESEAAWKAALLAGAAEEPDLLEAYCQAADAYFRAKVAVRRAEMLAEQAGQ